MWPRGTARRTDVTSSLGVGRGGSADAGIQFSAAFSSSSCCYNEEPPRPRPPQLLQDPRLPPVRTIFIKNVPSIVDNSEKLLPFVPSEGLISLRVKRTGGRDVGFAEYNTLELAYQALQWFYRLEVTAGIALNCFLQMMPKRTQIPPKFRYPVPYDEYNHCSGDPVSSTELLLNSVILIAEWSFSTPTYRPCFDSSAGVSQSSLHQHYFNNNNNNNNNNNTMMAACTPQRKFQTTNVKAHSPHMPHAGFHEDTCQPPPQMRAHLAHTNVLPTYSSDYKPEYNANEGNEFGSRYPPGNEGYMQQMTFSRNHSPGGPRAWQRCAHGEAEIPITHFNIPSSPSEVSQRNTLGSLLTPTTLNDKDPPRSTLFVRVMANTDSGPRQVGAPSSMSPMSSSLKDTVKLGETMEGFDHSLCSKHEGQEEKRSVRHMRLSSEYWSRFHHRHDISCMEEAITDCLPADNTTGNTSLECTVSPPHSFGKGETVGGELEVDNATPTTKPLTPTSLLSSVDSEGGDIEGSVIRTVLNNNFFSERFAGFRSYVAYSKRAGFVRFERSGDALQCLRWLRQQPELLQVVDVQFAREDTRRRRH